MNLEKFERKQGWSLEGLLFAILQRQLSIFFWIFAFHFVDFNIAFFNLQAERELTNF